VSGTYQQTGGTTNLIGSTLSATAINVQAGSLVGGDTVVGNLTNAGMLGSTSQFSTWTIQGGYTQTTRGTMLVGVGGLTPGTQFDQLSASGPSSLNGTLSLTVVNGFAPLPGENFLILNRGSEGDIRGGDRNGRGWGKHARSALRPDRCHPHRERPWTHGHADGDPDQHAPAATM
jgi:hypothetical protein